MNEPPDSPHPYVVTVDDEGSPVPIDAAWLEDIAARALSALGVPADAHLAITLVAPERMAELKEEALGVREPTDVLAWPMDAAGEPAPGPFVVGDVVLCPVVAEEQARAAGRSVRDEVALLLVHGVLHCLGRDHAEPDEERAMFAEQERIVALVEPGRAS